MYNKTKVILWTPSKLGFEQFLKLFLYRKKCNHENQYSNYVNQIL